MYTSKHKSVLKIHIKIKKYSAYYFTITYTLQILILSIFYIFQDLYDLLITFLAEKGISNTFVENLSDFSTQYEQKVYIKFLSDLRKFF
jgi:hypothetical protein